MNTIPVQKYVINGNISSHLVVKHSRQGNVSNSLQFDTKPNGVVPSCLHYPGWFYGWHGREFEYGTDFDCPFHTPIVALWNGVIKYAGRTCWNSNCMDTSGGAVVIDAYVPGLGNVSTYYLHLDTISGAVKVNDKVFRGEVIGLSGGQWWGGHWNVSPWRSSGPHIEIGFDAPFLFHDKGYNINPLPYIREVI